MFSDSTEISKGSTLECDIAIVGTGAAGATLASELADTNLKVIVLEGGGLKVERSAQSLNEGFVDAPRQHGNLAQYRRRVFGGTTSVWGGRCAPFDPIDFEARPYLKYSGWPLTREELNPYYERAHLYADLGQFTYNTSQAFAKEKLDLIQGLTSDNLLQDQIWRFSLPTNFGKANQRKLTDAANIRVILRANCIKVSTDHEGRSVQSILASSAQGHSFSVRARAFVLAAGGLETTRLLLASNDVFPSGLGNENDLLGRFYSSHIAGDLGRIAFTPRSRHIKWQYERTIDGVYCKRNLRISEQAQRQRGLLNFRCILSHPPFGDVTHRNGVLSAVYLVKRFFTHQISPEYSKELAASQYRNIGKHCRNVLLDAPNFARFSIHWLFYRILATRKFPSVAMPSASNTYTIHFDAEQSPNRESRVTLSDECDALGMPKLHVSWRHTGQDIESVARCYATVKSELESAGLAALEFDAGDVGDLLADRVGVGSHHIGTTRMSENPRLGVVDSNCRLHAVNNLFLASPSVFPTTSFANPVLTTAALAIRLADHLKNHF